MDSEIVVDVSEELLKAVDDWANYLSVSVPGSDCPCRGILFTGKK